MEERPQIKLVFTPADWIMEILGWLALLLLWGLTIYNYNRLPEIIPVHFGVSGKADGFGSRSTLFLLPIMGTIIVTGMAALNTRPDIFNYPIQITQQNALKQYTNATRVLRYVKLIIPVIFSAIVCMSSATATGKANGLSPWFLPLTMALIFVPLAFFLVKSRKTN